MLAAFAIVFIALELASYTQKSAVWDEPIHLMDGYASLARHDYRVDPEHPPLLRMWAALPLLATGATVDLATVERTAPVRWAWTLYPYCEKFLYFDNSGDRLLYPARFMIVLIGVGLGILVFLWARMWLGFWPAVVALVCYTIEPNIAASAALVTTDMGFAAFMFGSLFFLWRACRDLSRGNIAGLVVFFALAVVSKFSVFALAPIIVLLLAVAALRPSPVTFAKAAGLVGLLAVTSWVAIWGIYGFRYAPSDSPGWVYNFETDPQVQKEVPGLAGAASWIDGHHLLPNVYTQGFLFGQAKAQVRRAFLNGEVSDRGWWYYFPFAFAVKTPIAILGLLAVGLVAAALRWRELDLQNVLFVVIPIAAFMAAAMTTRLNIGVRHLLPIYPFVMLLAGVAAKWLLEKGRAGAIALCAVVAIGVVEFGSNYPDNLAFFNAFVGGPAHGSEYLVDSNLDWGQDLKPLKRWMDENHVPHINLAYFGTAYPPYYGINATYLPGSEYFQPNPNVQLPGYVAISATVLRGVYLDDTTRAFYRPFVNMPPVATIGHSIFVYRVEQPWW